MPNDIRNPFPTERIRPATNMSKNDFIGLKIYESNQKNMFIFLSKITIVPRYGISKKTSWT